MKGIIYTLLTLCFVTMSCVGIYFGVNTVNTEKTQNNDFTITDVDEVIEDMEMTIEDLAPGKSHSYNIDIKCQIPNEKYLTLKFKTAGDTALSSFVDVKITYNNQIITKKLDELLKGEIITLEPEEKDIPIIITYSMSQDIGNDAQNKEAHFNIEIKIIDKEI